MERSHIPLSKWVLAAQLMASSKKSMSAHQLMRMLNVTYEAAWFLFHRLREAASDVGGSGPLGGANEVVEADETFIGGIEGNKHKSKRTPGRQGGAGKAAVVTLVERDGRARSRHIANIDSDTLKPILQAHIDRRTYLMTDESAVYPPIAKGFSGHGTVNHSAEEYVRGVFWHTNTVEGFFALLKRAVYGQFHHVSEAHLHRYLAEADFKYTYRASRGFDDQKRAAELLRGAKGKRLLYRQPDGGASA
jgi:hypothetical protein